MMGPMRKKWTAFLCTLLALALCACGEKPAEDEAPPDGEDAGPYVLTVQVGGAQVSEKHCGFVINKEQASATDIRSLMEQVSEKVYAQFGVRLEPEVKLIGEF